MMRNQSIKVIIFDFDGTIADTTTSIAEIFNKIAPKYNLPFFKESDLDYLRDNSMSELIQRYDIGPVKLLKLVAEIQSELKNNIENTPPIPGMIQVLNDLEKQGVAVGIVSSNTTENIRLFLAKNKITNIGFVYSEKTLFGKGKILTNLIRKQRLSKSEVIYVGDEVRDVDAAFEARVFSAAVTWGFNSEKRLKRARPDFIVNKPRDLVKKISLFRS
jgi:phosphoglycolate phosphatase